MVLGKVAITLGRIAGIAAFSLLTACGGGGGGGGGGSSGGGGSTTPPPTTSGLIPTAPTVGATLVADATTLRPLIDGAIWSYAGTSVGSTKYINTVSQSSSAGGFTESTTNAFNEGADSQFVSAASGVITNRTSLSLTGGTPQQLNYTELRSPVRQNDQITQLDQHLADIGSDVDGDGKRDAGDIAVYSRVIGMEDVTLLDGSVQHAVRVDTTALMRVTASSTGKTTDPVQLLQQSTWYAVNIGIVKQRLTTAQTPTYSTVQEEVLLGLDKGTSGVGTSGVAALNAGPDAGSLSGAPLRGASTVVAFADHAIVVGTVQGGPSGQVALSSVNKRGQVTHTSLHAFAYNATYLNVGGKLVVVESGPALCTATLTTLDGDGLGDGSQRSTVTFGASAVPGGPANASCASVDNPSYASDGTRVWIAGLRRTWGTGDVAYDLFMQPFDLSGQAAAPAAALFSATSPSATAYSPFITNLSASNGRAQAYVFNAVASGSVQLASVNGDGTVGALVPLSQLGPTDYTRLVSVPTGSALFWMPPNYYNANASVRGALLSPTLTPLLGGNGTVDGQVLSPALTGPVANLATFVPGYGNDIIGVGYWDHFLDGSLPYMNLVRYVAGSTALAAQTPTPVRVPLWGNGGDLANSSPMLVPLQDRVLVFSNVAGGLLIVGVAWLQ